MGFLLPELSTIGYNCAPHYCFKDTQVKKQKQTKQLNPNKPSFSATISSTSNKLFWSAPEFLLTTLADTPSKKLFSQIQFRSEWSKPSTGGSKSYLSFNSFCTPNLEAKDESSANLIRIVMQALFTPPWRHSQGENWLSKLCKSRSAASMGGTEGARTTLLLLYAYTFKKKKKSTDTSSFLCWNMIASLKFCYSKFLIIVLLSLHLHNSDKVCQKTVSYTRTVLTPWVRQQ